MTTIIQLLICTVPVGKSDGAVGQMPFNDDICDENHSVAGLYLLAKVTVPLDM